MLLTRQKLVCVYFCVLLWVFLILLMYIHRIISQVKPRVSKYGFMTSHTKIKENNKPKLYILSILQWEHIFCNIIIASQPGILVLRQVLLIIYILGKGQLMLNSHEAQIPIIYSSSHRYKSHRNYLPFFLTLQIHLYKYVVLDIILHAL